MRFSVRGVWARPARGRVPYGSSAGIGVAPFRARLLDGGAGIRTVLLGVRLLDPGQDHVDERVPRQGGGAAQHRERAEPDRQKQQPERKEPEPHRA